MCFWVSAAVLFGFFKSTFLGTDESPCSQEEASTSAAVIVSIDFDLHFPVLLRKRFAVICMSISPIYVQKSGRWTYDWDLRELRWKNQRSGLSLQHTAQSQPQRRPGSNKHLDPASLLSQGGNLALPKPNQFTQ